MEAKIVTVKALRQQLLKIKNIKSESFRKQGEKLRLQASFTKILLCKQILRRLIIHAIRISALKWLFCLIWWNVGCFYSKKFIHMRYTCLIKDLTKNGRYKYVSRNDEGRSRYMVCYVILSYCMVKIRYF